MDCIRAQQLIKGYLEGQLSDRDLEAFLDHVAGCRKCYDELEIYFSVYHLIDDRKDDGNYNFIEKLNRRLEKSREYLKKRMRYKIFRVVLVILAELVLLMSVIGAYTYRYMTDETEVRSETGPRENPEGEAYVDGSAGEKGSGESSATEGGSGDAETIAAGPEETGSGSRSSDTEGETAVTEAEEAQENAGSGNGAEAESTSAGMTAAETESAATEQETEPGTGAETEAESEMTESELPDAGSEEKALEKTREELYYVIGQPVPKEKGGLSSRGEEK
jgi:hypothetical protein